MNRAVRVIACLDVDDGRVVKGINFTQLTDAGDPVEMARLYSREGADELTFLDISASADDRQTTRDAVRRAAGEITIPLTVGGGVRSVDDIETLLGAGAAKVSIGTAAIGDPDLLTRASEKFGSDVLVLSVDARRSAGQPSGFEITTHGGRRLAGRDAIEWVETASRLGVGEVLLNSMDTDGTSDGFDLEMIAAARQRTLTPLIASGGAGSTEHFCRAADAGADALLAASAFHFGGLHIGTVKNALGADGHRVFLEKNDA